MARVSVPLLAVKLLLRLPVIALVSHYLTNKLIGRGPIVKWSSVRISFTLKLFQVKESIEDY